MSKAFTTSRAISLAPVRKPVWPTMRWSGRTDWPSMCQQRCRTSIVSAMANPASASASRNVVTWEIVGR